VEKQRPERKLEGQFGTWSWQRSLVPTSHGGKGEIGRHFSELEIGRDKGRDEKLYSPD
jgi:hypothetical protein